MEGVGHGCVGTSKEARAGVRASHLYRRRRDCIRLVKSDVTGAALAHRMPRLRLGGWDWRDARCTPAAVVKDKRRAGDKGDASPAGMDVLLHSVVVEAPREVTQHEAKRTAIRQRGW